MLKQYGLTSEQVKEKMNDVVGGVEKVKDGGKYVEIIYKDGSIGHYGYNEFRFILLQYNVIDLTA